MISVADRVSTLVELPDVLRCPICSFRSSTALEWAPEAIARCHRRRCLQRWWTMRLGPGDVGRQLAGVFGEELACNLRYTFRLPQHLDRPMYWRLVLSRRQYAEARSLDTIGLVGAILRRTAGRTISLLGTRLP